MLDALPVATLPLHLGLGTGIPLEGLAGVGCSLTSYP